MKDLIERLKGGRDDVNALGPERIWLQPGCCADNEHEGRLWSQDRFDECDDEEHDSDTMYVRADLVASLSKRIEDLEGERDEWKNRAHGYELRLGNLGRDLTNAESLAADLAGALENLIAHTAGVNLPTTAYIMRAEGLKALSRWKGRETRNYVANTPTGVRTPPDGASDVIESDAASPLSGVRS